MIKNVLWASVFALIAALLQSTLLSRLALFRAVPDLALIIIVYSAYVNGSMTGQLAGFCSGIFLDFLSTSPLGLNMLIRTLAGSLVGLFKGMFFLDFLFLPMILCAAATIFKALVFFLLHLLLAPAVPSYTLFGVTFWVELGLNTFLAPFLFGFLKLFEGLLAGQKENV
jgi:rod shape-determining protein MreD